MAKWKIDNKIWVKDRKAAWKVIKKKIDTLIFLDKNEKASIKEYYLTGIENSTYPINKMEGGLLLELWLDPDKSDEHWKTLKSKYTYEQWYNSRFRFLEANRGMYETSPNGESFFDELEERLCHWFHFDRLRREDWPDMTDEQFHLEAKNSIKLARSFISYFMNEKPHPYDMLLYSVQYWHDSMVLAFENFLQLSSLVRWTSDIINNPNNYEDTKVKLANKIKDVINATDLPDKAKKCFSELKKEHDCNF